MNGAQWFVGWYRVKGEYPWQITVDDLNEVEEAIANDECEIVVITRLSNDTSRLLSGVKALIYSLDNVDTSVLWRRTIQEILNAGIDIGKQNIVPPQ